MLDFRPAPSRRHRIILIGNTIATVLSGRYGRPQFGTDAQHDFAYRGGHHGVIRIDPTTAPLAFEPRLIIDDFLDGVQFKKYNGVDGFHGVMGLPSLSAQIPILLNPSRPSFSPGKRADRRQSARQITIMLSPPDLQRSNSGSCPPATIPLSHPPDPCCN
jgi:hypothetical protein